MTIATGLPNENDVLLARDTRNILAHAHGNSLTVMLRRSDGSEQQVQLPSIALPALDQVLMAIEQGQAVEVIGIQSELTISAAATLLHVSQSYLLTLLETNQIPHYQVNSEKFLHYADVVKYKTDIDTARRKVLDELVAEAQEMNLGYE